MASSWHLQALGLRAGAGDWRTWPALLTSGHPIPLNGTSITFATRSDQHSCLPTGERLSFALDRDVSQRRIPINNRRWVCLQAGSPPGGASSSTAAAAAPASGVSAPSAPTEAPSGPPAPSPIKQESDVRLVPLSKNTSSLRGRSYERLKFEIEYGLKRGTTENTYLIRGSEGMALVDVPDAAFRDAFVTALVAAEKELGSNLTHIILGHLSPKRVETLEAVGKSRQAGASPLKVYCSNPAAQTLQSALPEAMWKGDDSIFQVVVVRPGNNLDLGEGHDLKFILTPTPRWPDGLATYDPVTQFLFSHKLFSAHVCEETDYDVGGWELYGEHWRFFYDCMLAPVARQADAALEKLPIVSLFARPSYTGKKGLDVVKADLGFIWTSMAQALNLAVQPPSFLTKQQTSAGGLPVAAICPLHGPVVRSSLTELVREYREWTLEKIKQAEEATVAVIFASAYGNTSAMAQAISRGILKAGVGCEIINCEQSDTAEVAALVKRCSGFVVGSPTLGGHMPTPVTEALGAILSDPTARSKPCGVFGSFGWSGEAVDEMEKRLKDGGFNFAFPAIRCKFKPTESMVQTCEESGTDLAQVVKREKQKQRVKEAPAFSKASNVEQAAGRLVGALCVVSARSGDAESAMLASWVSQASFNPPGITVAVSKERAIEGLILPGGQFVLNILGTEKAGPVSKQLLKPFKPGERRFGDLKVKEAPNGAAILEDALSYLECEVTSRMETGDHWVLYATVKDGQLQDDKGVTAVHHRKTGARY
eukprot:TRINITY_DN26466_c0_g1_i1.p1 TRINITY_DN26466_c0_g1~~TRINITY_DN26466_c0_g1_i1.p1  ORF type:complete len:789 (-),score=133.43 TRINITY_DN26466_c0_g1_i1:533-2827(-)